MNPEELSIVVLGIVGVILQLLFLYVPKVKTWYEAQPNKGLLMLGFTVLIGAIYFALGCTSLAIQLGIATTCDVNGLFAMLKALFIVATSQQLTYLYTRNSKAFRTLKP